jgi:hypothetical protein
LGLALMEHARKRKLAPWMAGGVVACALLLVPPTARADDSLWGKAMNTIGLGGKGSSNQTSGQQPAAAASQPAPAAAQPAPPAAAASDKPNLLTNFFGWGRHDNPQPTDQAALQPPRKAMTPVQTPPPPSAPASGGGPGLWDQMLGSVGLTARNPTANIYYADRPKLTVPKNDALPQPGPLAEPSGARHSNPHDLVQPPEGYLEKVRGADGNVSGLRSGDISKDKKFFGLF